MQPNLLGETIGFRARFAVLGVALAATIALFVTASPCETARAARAARAAQMQSIEVQLEPRRPARSFRCGKGPWVESRAGGMSRYE